MNRKLSQILIPALMLILASVGFANDRKSLTVADIYHADKFKGKTITDIQWHPDGSYFTFSRHNAETGQLDIYKHLVKTGEETLLLAGTDLKYKDELINLSSYRWTEDGKYLLLAGKVDKIWRHSFQAPHFLYQVDTGKLISLANDNPGLRNVKLSPDGRWIGYVSGHNISIYDLKAGEEKAITHDGTPNVLNGEFDWVYEEEFGLADAWRWSPDGKKIAYWQIDQTRVKAFHLVDEIPLYNTVFSLKYPEAGEQNALVRIGVADIETGETTWVDLGENPDIYVPRIFWTNSSKQLAVLRLNRHQNHLELLLADSRTGATRKIIEDRNNTWIDVRQDILFLKTRDQIIWPSERSGYKHAYIYDYDGNLLQQVTGGDWEISAVVGVDEQNDWLYFYGKKDSPLEQNVYRVHLDGSDLHRISQRDGWHRGSFSPDYQHVVGFFSDVSTPTQIMLRKTDGALVRWLEKNEMPALHDYVRPKVEFLTVTTSDGVQLNAYMIKPIDFDQKKTYPVLVYGYGGPGSQRVTNRWGSNRTLWHQMLTQKGYIVFCLDNRGTGGRGKAFKDLAYGDISKWAVHDQIEGARYLATLPFVDKERIGFWGWSGGGYLTLMVMMRGADYFKTGVSVAPVSDFRLYDTIWTERYMGLPQENAEGYQAANVLEYVDGLQGNLLIIHGTGDDNVHVQNTMQVINALQNRAIQFDMMLYPNRNHRISGGKTQLHLFTYITNYLLRRL
ncbi:MAG: DPP IV N-terminal domain-containing protein [bacterium]